MTFCYAFALVLIGINSLNKVIGHFSELLNILSFCYKLFNAYTAEEFIAAITQHIPEKSFQMVRYYGWYSNKSRGMRLKQGMVRPGDEPLEKDTEIEIIDVSEYEPKRIPTMTWRECIKKIWEVDPLLCPNCVGEMKISAFNLHRSKHNLCCIL